VIIRSILYLQNRNIPKSAIIDAAIRT